MARLRVLATGFILVGALLPARASANCEVAYAFRALHTIAEYVDHRHPPPLRFVLMSILPDATVVVRRALLPLEHSGPDPARPLRLESAAGACSYPALSGKEETLGGCVNEDWISFPPCVHVKTEALRQESPGLRIGDKDEINSWLTGVAVFDGQRNAVRVPSAWVRSSPTGAAAAAVEAELRGEWQRYGVQLGGHRVDLGKARPYRFRHEVFSHGRARLRFTQVKFTLSVATVFPSLTKDRSVTFEGTAVFFKEDSQRPVLFAQSGGCEGHKLEVELSQGVRPGENVPVPDYDLGFVADLNGDDRIDLFEINGAYYYRYRGRYYFVHYCCGTC